MQFKLTAVNPLVQNGLTVLREHRRAYMAINVGYYGMIIACMVFVVFFPEVQRNLLEDIRKYAHQEGQGVMKSVFTAYAEGRVTAAIALTFAVNFVIGSLLFITVPSLIVPFSGLLTGFIRAGLWGLFMSPADPSLRWTMVPHSLTVLLEGQAYILAMLAAYQQGLALFRPNMVGAESWRQGIATGVKRTASLYVLIVILLAVAAVYEALELIYLAPRL
jgi:hypothetical protein